VNKVKTRKVETMETLEQKLDTFNLILLLLF